MYLNDGNEMANYATMIYEHDMSPSREVTSRTDVED